MNGVEILAAHEVMATTFNWYVFIIGAIIVTAVMFLLSLKYIIPTSKLDAILLATFSTILLICPVGAIASVTGERVPSYTEYKVQLSDEVPIAEFLSTYEIIGQEGQILTIREKEFAENG